MRALPWYLRKSPLLFCSVAAVKFVELVFAVIGYRAWSNEHSSSLLLGIRLLDEAIYASAWLGSAILASLLLVILDRGSPSNA